MSKLYIHGVHCTILVTLDELNSALTTCTAYIQHVQCTQFLTLHNYQD